MLEILDSVQWKGSTLVLESIRSGVFVYSEILRQSSIYYLND